MEENKAYEAKDVIDKINSGDYHLSFSSLPRFAYSPRNFIQYQLDKLNGGRKVTDAMKMGTALHEIFLEGRLYSLEVLPKDRPEKPTKAQLNAKKKSDSAKERIEFWSKYEDRLHEVITTEQYSKVQEYVELCKNNNEAFGLKLFGDVEVEEIIEYKGFTIKRKMDILGSDYIADLKKCPDVRFFKFARKVRDEYLHLQAAIYLLGREYYDYKWIAVDGKDCIVHSIGNSALRKGFALLDYYLDEFKKLTKKGVKDWLKGREYWEKNSIIDF